MTNASEYIFPTDAEEEQAVRECYNAALAVMGPERLVLESEEDEARATKKVVAAMAGDGDVWTGSEREAKAFAARLKRTADSSWSPGGPFFTYAARHLPLRLRREAGRGIKPRIGGL